MKLGGGNATLEIGALAFCGGCSGAGAGVGGVAEIGASVVGAGAGTTGNDPVAEMPPPGVAAGGVLCAFFCASTAA